MPIPVGAVSVFWEAWGLRMVLVPRQISADEDVIAYWTKNARLNAEEISALIAGVNPFVWRDRFASRDNAGAISETQAAHIRDLETLIEHRLDVFNRNHSISEWKRILLELEVPIPTWLNQIRSKRTDKSLEYLRDQTLPEGMPGDLTKMREPRGIPILLKKWFLHDTWTSTEGVFLLSGLDPHGTVVKEAKTSYGEVRDEIEVAAMLDGSELPSKTFLDNQGHELAEPLNNLQVRLAHLSSLWNSGSHQSRNPPLYYINWAESKEYEIPWRDWATEVGLLNEKMSPAQEQNVVESKERTSYLNIIGAMVELILGISPGGKPHSAFKSQSAIIEALLAHHPARPGISKRNLEEKFAEARRNIALS